jgi:hypothetical protein
MPTWRGRLDGAHIVVLDKSAAAACLPAGQGVGLARRIGLDIALALYRDGRLASRWLHTTDADATLPDDYFVCASRLAGDTGIAALTYPFWHVAKGGGPPSDALALYELSLRYYVLGLRSAGSPYAFHSVGSAMAIDAPAYACARGVPSVAAGEDFYLLNKVAKLGRVVEPDVAPITLEERRQVRVPFGTASGTGRFARTLSEGGTPAFYDPEVFVALGEILDTVFSLDPTGVAPDGALDTLRTPVRAVVLAMGFEKAMRDARERTRSAAACRRRMREWFDGFRTLKAIHALRDAAWPRVPWHDALARAPFGPGHPLPPLTALRNDLMARERADVPPAGAHDTGH